MTHFQPNGYLAVPTTGTGPGVLVLHAWWGLNDTMKSFCKLLAESGFVAFAPDLYHGKVVETIPEAQALATALNSEQAQAEIAEATEYINERAGQEERGLAVVGFSLGANYALDLSVSDPKHIHSVVVFYGTGTDDFSNSRASYLGHFAENDPYEPKEAVDHLEEALQQAGRPATIYRYPGTGHWFFEPDRPDAFNQKAASLAWKRTRAFLTGSDSA
jgi:carboxymethylenebutenolidase